MKKLAAGLAPALLLLPPAAVAEPIGEVDTALELIGAGHKIVVDAYDDPKVVGVTCYVSRAKTGPERRRRDRPDRWHIALAYVVGLFVMLALIGFHPDSVLKSSAAPQTGHAAVSPR